MKWTRKAPTKEGMYWYKDRGIDPILVDIQINNDKLIVVYELHSYILEEWIEDCKDVYWSDVPIQFPEGGDKNGNNTD